MKKLISISMSLIILFSVESTQAQDSSVLTDGNTNGKVPSSDVKSIYYIENSNSTQSKIFAITETSFFRRKFVLSTNKLFQKMSSSGYSDYEQGSFDGKLAAGGKSVMLSGVVTGVIISSSLSAFSGYLVNAISQDYNIDEKAGRDAIKLSIVTPIVGAALSAVISLLIPTNAPNGSIYTNIKRSDDYNKGFIKGYKRSKRRSRFYSSVVSGFISGSLVMLYVWNFKTDW